MHITRITTALAVTGLIVSALGSTAFADPGPASPSIRSGKEVRANFEKEPAALAAATDDAPVDAGMPGDGYNNISFDYFEDGDVILGFDTWSVGHAGILDGTRDISASTFCVWSAIKDGSACVLLEQGAKYRGYDYAYGLWVPSASPYQRSSARRFASSQKGEPYVLTSAKTDYSRWYCSKLPWAGYRDRAAKDLDANGGYWVAPVDLYNDNDTAVFASAN